MDVLMLVTTDVAHDSRVLREAETLAGEGHSIHVLGKDVPADWRPPRGVTVESASGGTGLNRLRPAGAPAGRATPAVTSTLGRALRWMLLPRHRQRVWRTWRENARAAAAGRSFDVVHAHDFNVLPLAASLADAPDVRLVYDAHEWWSGRQRHGRPTPMERRQERRQERRMVRHADAVLTVSEGIARRLESWHGRPVTVVRNTFPRRVVAGAPLPTRPSALVYAGRVGAGRDLETVLVAATSAGLDAHLVGPIDESYLPRVWELSRARMSTTSVHVQPTLPIDEVDDVLRRRGISVITLTDTCENHRLALPNKLFHAVRAGVPVVAADLPEMRRVVSEYGLGELYRPGDAASMRAALQRLVENYPQWCERVARVRDELCWERDAGALVAVYRGLPRTRSSRATATAQPRG